MPTPMTELPSASRIDPSTRARPTDLRHPAQAQAAMRASETLPQAHPWRDLAQAQQTGDRHALARASMALARMALTASDLDEARWHLQRGRSTLDTLPGGADVVHLQCESAGLTLQLARQWQGQQEMLSRRLADEVRDACFEVARACLALDDTAARVSALLHAAELLESLGDSGDAQGLRMQAFHGLGRGSALPL